MAGKLPEQGNVWVTLCADIYPFGEDDGQDLGRELRKGLTHW